MKGSRRLRIAVVSLLVLTPPSFCLAMALATPAEMRVERSRRIEAPPSVVRSKLVDLRALAEWDPWAPPEGSSRTTIFGPGDDPRWVEWHGQDSTARLTLSSASETRVRYRFEYPDGSVSGYTAHTIDLAPSGGGTRVTWTVTAEHDLLRRAFRKMVGIERTIGESTERGLARLATACVESP